MLLKDELSSTQESLDDAKLRNTRCEEIIKEMREKLGSELKESEHQNEVNSRLRLDYKTLEDIHYILQDELSAAEDVNRKHANEILLVEEKSDKKQKQLEVLDNNLTDLSMNLKTVIVERTRANEKASFAFKILHTQTITCF